MKNLRETLFPIPFLCALAATACSGGGGSGDPATTTSGEVVAEGELQLSGADTGAVGTRLEIGDVALVRDEGQPDTYYCIDRGSRVSGFEYSLASGPGDLFGNTVLADPLNTFVINAIAGGLDGISMTILVGGVGYDYVCVSCAGLGFDTDNRMITFDGVEVMPSGSAATGPLTLDGTILWGIPQ